jgi:hypothetical protein
MSSIANEILGASNAVTGAIKTGIAENTLQGQSVKSGEPKNTEDKPEANPHLTAYNALGEMAEQRVTKAKALGIPSTRIKQYEKSLAMGKIRFITAKRERIQVQPVVPMEVKHGK